MAATSISVSTKNRNRAERVARPEANGIGAEARLAAGRRPGREDLKPGEVLCQYCTAKCCRYFALPIDEPKSWKDFEYIRWYLLHDRATVFTEDGTWYLLVHTKCQHLGDDNLCKAYETRPQICREYTTDKCEYDDRWVYDRYFETPEQVEEYAEAVLPPRKGRGLRTPKPKKLNPEP